MTLHIATGDLSASPDGLLPLDATGLPGVAPVTATVGGLSGPTYPGRVYDYQAQVAGDETACAAAQSAGMDARNAMLSHYANDVLPVGCSYGDPLAAPEVPEDATSPTSDFLYPMGNQPGA